MKNRRRKGIKLEGIENHDFDKLSNTIPQMIFHAFAQFLLHSCRTL